MKPNRSPTPNRTPCGSPRVRGDRARAVIARDAALERIGRARRWILVASVGLTGALAGLASALLPGKSFGASRGHRGSGAASSTASAARSRGRSAASTAPALPAAAGPAQLGLQGPAQPLPSAQSSPPASAPAPAASGGGGAVVSGGS